MMGVLHFITAASLLCGAWSLPQRVFIYVNQLKNWSEARSFCREMFIDLVTISSMEDMTVLTNVVDLDAMLYQSADYKYRAWIGLFDDVDGWRWSTSDPNRDDQIVFWNWGGGEPNNSNGAESCGGMLGNGVWIDWNCGESAKAVCYDAQGQDAQFVLTNESLTWAAAQSYCREHHSDLAWVRTTAENEKIKGLVQSAGLNTVWIGLYRNTWTWVDGSSFLFRHWRTSEPDGSQENCAAAVLMDEGLWEDWICNWKMPFFCYGGKSLFRFSLAEQFWVSENRNGWVYRSIRPKSMSIGQKMYFKNKNI